MSASVNVSSPVPTTPRVPAPRPIAPLIAIVAAIVLSSTLLMVHFFGSLSFAADLLPWQIYIAIMVLFMPFYIFESLVIARRSLMLALFFVLVVAQSMHFIEHIAQMTQIHLLGLSGTQAHGLIGMLDLEWVHFIFDGLIITTCAFILIFPFRRNPYLWALLPIAVWHATEHVFIITYYIRTGIAGSPGLLAQGGLINGGLPIDRPDLHFLYNLAEETLIVLGFFYQWKHMPRQVAAKPKAATAVAAPEAVAVAQSGALAPTTAEE
jgi:hypothetical protein